MSAATRLYFDDSLPVFARIVAKYLGADELRQGRIVRDSVGRLFYVSLSEPPADPQRAALESELIASLGGYVRSDRIIAFHDEPGVDRLLKDQTAVPIQIGEFELWLLDRRIVGSAWIDAPAKQLARPPHFVFASLKGGVGRSTALAIAAADLARRNRNVLVVDLDLEAPGIGSILLDDDRLPRFGTLDYLLENGLNGIEDGELSDFLGTSSLTLPGGGRVDVLPAFGLQSLSYPGNTLAKLGRALIEDLDESGNAISLSNQIVEMLRRFNERSEYDAVLIDSRAGLSELTAPPILGLGASVFLFGTGQRQTLQGFEALLAALKPLARRDLGQDHPALWRRAFKAVLAKAPASQLAFNQFRDDLYDLFADNLYDADAQQNAEFEGVAYDIDDPTAPHFPTAIFFSPGFLDFDPVRAPDQLSPDFYEAAFRPFLRQIDTMIDDRSAASDETGTDL